MDFKSINNKEIINGKLKMVEPVILFRDDVQVLATHTVTKFEVGRIDVIANIYYRNPSNAELILKFNNISNPFSIKEGDEILIPDSDNVIKAWNKIKPIDSENNEIDSIRGQFMDSKRLSVKDAKRIEYLKKKASQKKNGSKEMLPPNILKPREINIDITDNSITI